MRARVPRRIVPAFSEAVPMRKPGWSTKFATGRRNWSQMSTKRPSLSLGSPVSPPPEWCGPPARMPARPPAAVGLRVAGQDADGPPVEPRQRGDERAPVARADLEDRPAVEHGLED